MSERPIALITQRRDPRPGDKEAHDTLGSSWSDALWEAGYLPFPAVNLAAAAAAQFRTLRPALVVLSEGPEVRGESAPERDAAEASLISLASNHCTPLLGICRGAQMLALAAGMKLTRINGGADRCVLEGPLVEAWHGPAKVATSHHWGIDPDSVSAGWRVVASAPDGTVAAIASTSAPSLGVLWHPEREPRHLPSLLAYFTSLCSAFSSSSFLKAHPV